MTINLCEDFPFNVSFFKVIFGDIIFLKKILLFRETFFLLIVIVTPFKYKTLFYSVSQ